MFPQLVNELDMSIDRLSNGKFVLVSESGTDASFVLQNFASMYIKSDFNVFFLGLSQTFNHYNSVATKLGCPWIKARDNGKLVFEEAMKTLGSNFILPPSSVSQNNDIPYKLDFSAEKGHALKQLFEYIVTKIKNMPDSTAVPTVLIIDDLSMFTCLGVSVLDVYYFVHYLIQVKQSYPKLTIVTLTRRHKTKSDEDTERLYLLLQSLCDLIIDAQGLTTGYCKDVDGEVTIRKLQKGKPANPDKRMMQYKILPKTVSFFAQGTSSAVL